MPTPSDRRCRRWIGVHFRRRPLLPFLLAATAMLNLAMLLRDTGDLALSASIAECGLIGLWAGRLRGGWPMRLVLAPFGVFALAIMFAVTDRKAVGEVATVLGLYTVVIAAISVGVQVATRLVRRRFGEVRFSLGGMLLGMTITACLVALLKFADFPGDDPIEMAIGFGSLGLLPLLAGAVAERVEDSLAAAAGIFLATFFAAICFYVGMGSGPSGEWVPLIFSQGVIIGVWLLGVRSRGRRRRSANDNQAVNEQGETSSSLAEQPAGEPAGDGERGSLDLKA